MYLPQINKIILENLYVIIRKQLNLLLSSSRAKTKSIIII
jgi:hypothetical protein